MEATIQSFVWQNIERERREQEARARELFWSAEVEQTMQPWTPRPTLSPQPAQPPIDLESVITFAVRESIFAGWKHYSPESFAVFRLSEMAIDSPQIPEWVKILARFAAVGAMVVAVNDADKATKPKRKRTTKRRR